MPAIITAIDCYCALATRLRFKYTYDLDPHALLLQVLVVAEAASGKSFTRSLTPDEQACVSRTVQHLLLHKERPVQHLPQRYVRAHKM